MKDLGTRQVRAHSAELNSAARLTPATSRRGAIIARRGRECHVHSTGIQPSLCADAVLYLSEPKLERGSGGLCLKSQI
jgi:hypothetical protein